MSHKIKNFQRWKNSSDFSGLEEEFENSDISNRQTMKHHKQRFDDGSRNTKTKQRK